MVLITDGVDTGSKTSKEKAIEAAQKADVIIYSIDYEDPRALRRRLRTNQLGGGQGERDLRRMSTETGGRVFKVDRKNSLDDIFRELQEEMRSQYSIGYARRIRRRTAGIARSRSRSTEGLQSAGPQRLLRDRERELALWRESSHKRIRQ